VGKLFVQSHIPTLPDTSRVWAAAALAASTLLARMARFIIADLTDPSSIPKELEAIVPNLAVPVQPLLLEGSSLYSMFNDFDPLDYHWVLPVYQYKEPKQLLAALATKVIAPAEAKVEAFEERKRKIEAELAKPR
jgi:hypothetical protein